MDKEVAEQISKHALMKAQIENEMAKLEGMLLICMARKCTTTLELKYNNAKAEAVTLKISANAQNQCKVEAAKIMVMIVNIMVVVQSMPLMVPDCCLLKGLL
ncbi:hypothetical protein ACA910_018449 [Epithemia clementina (nom. ined.)]